MENRTKQQGAARVIPPEEMARQEELLLRVRDRYLRRPSGPPKACTVTLGCQQNSADTELLRRMLFDMGFTFTDEAQSADLVIINTCTIREHAEQRAFGNVGELSHAKRRNPDMVIAVCGCMAQRPQAAEKLKHSFPYVDLVFGPHALYRFPELLLRRLEGGWRVFETEESEGVIIEGLAPYREEGPKAWLSIMYGCNNYCTYCVVPYVRGRERSRAPERIIDEFRALVEAGVKDITLLGQNVNSYGGADDCDFPELLRRLDRIEGDHRIRFMTSHPKDATPELFDVMAGSEHICRSIHLPVQAGSNRVLKAMNRSYTTEKYLDLVAYARRVMPDLCMTSDIMVGFPGETEEDFQDTLALLKTVRYDSLFTFIYSPREPSAAAAMPGHLPKEVQQDRFDRLCEVQNQISREINLGCVGKRFTVLIDGENEGEYNLSGRTEGFKLVHVAGPSSLIGAYRDVEITEATTWALKGKLTETRG